jgi:hypothetical protein
VCHERMVPMTSMRVTTPERRWRPLAAGLAVLILRTHLTVSDAGLADHRMFRVVRVPWQLITGFKVDRPGSLWGGYCVTAVRRDGSAIDLISPRAYSRVPAGQHVD